MITQNRYILQVKKVHKMLIDMKIKNAIKSQREKKMYSLCHIFMKTIYRQLIKSVSYMRNIKSFKPTFYIYSNLFILSASMYVASDSYAQATHTSTANVKSTATLAATCTIASQNINFGQIVLPVNAQSATSTMTVQCTKGSSYTIGLAYGGVYGKGTAGGNYYVYTNYGVQTHSGVNYTYYYYNEYNSSGTYLTQYTAVVGCPQSGACSGSSTPPGTTYNSTTKSYVTGSTPYAYGLLNGSSKGDSIGYSIQVPNNPSEVWNAGEYSYTSTGTGINQSIPIVATLSPSHTANSYPAADTYLDTIVATINY
jgi:spore coat protein U-like protein